MYEFGLGNKGNMSINTSSGLPDHTDSLKRSQNIQNSI